MNERDPGDETEITIDCLECGMWCRPGKLCPFGHRVLMRYDPSKVIVTFNGVELRGFSDASYIRVDKVDRSN